MPSEAWLRETESRGFRPITRLTPTGGHPKPTECSPEASKGSPMQPCFAQFRVQGLGLVALLCFKAPSGLGSTRSIRKAAQMITYSIPAARK